MSFMLFIIYRNHKDRLYYILKLELSVIEFVEIFEISLTWKIVFNILEFRL